MKDTALVPIERNPLTMPSDQWGRMQTIASEGYKSGLLPGSIKSPQQAFIVILKGYELGLPPMYSLERISVINGKACIDGQLMLRLILERLPGAVVEFPVQTDKEARVAMKRTGGKMQEFSFTWADAEKAQLTGKDSWKKYPAAMLAWRAVAKGARLVFPDAIGGCYLVEEMRELKDVEGEVVPPSHVETRAPTMPAEETISAEKVALLNYVVKCGTVYRNKALGQVPKLVRAEWRLHLMKTPPVPGLTPDEAELVTKIEELDDLHD